MSVEINGLEQINQMLKRLEEGNALSQSTFDTIGNMISNSIEFAFENQKSPFGQNWKPLKQSTLAQKVKRGGSERILRDSGHLADNWHIASDNKSVTVSNNSSHKGFAYGLAHQFGANAGRGHKSKIPARPFLPVDENGKLEPNLEENIKRFLAAEIASKLS